MLTRAYRLSKSRDIKRVLREGKIRSAEQLFAVKFLPNYLPNDRLTVIVSQKVSKKATIRNRIRRSLIGALTIPMLKDGVRHYDSAVIVRGINKENLKKARKKFVEIIEAIHGKDTNHKNSR